MSTTHERDIPSIAAKASDVKLSECYSKLSFALADSLAVAKRLTWEQTPWLNPRLDVEYCQRIAEYVSLQLDMELDWIPLTCACLLGEVYEEPPYQDPESLWKTKYGANPQLFVVFPHLKRDVTQDEAFLKVWHDEIILPAFNRAWEDSGLVELEGASKDFVGHIKSTPGGLHHTKEGYPAAGFLEHLRKRRIHRVHTLWPEWHDYWSGGNEGQHSDKRAKVYDDAWVSIRGMLENHPQMKDLQGAFLLVVNRSQTDFNTDWSVPQIYQAVRRRWDRCVDARYVVAGSFKVVVNTVVGDVNQVEEAVEGEFRMEEEERKKVAGVDFKRTVEAVGDADTAVVKRRKTHGSSVLGLLGWS